MFVYVIFIWKIFESDDVGLFKTITMVTKEDFAKIPIEKLLDTPTCTL
jgi:hypothetical protein